MHEEALKSNAALLFPQLRRFKDFYLVGGTALSLHIGHRISADFDLFSTKNLPSRLLQQIKRVFKSSSVTVTYRSFEQLNVVIDDVQCTFLTFEYPLIDKLVYYKKVPLASVREIAVMKAFSIGKRLSYKDYVDWYFLLKERHIKLLDIITLAQKKFGNDFNDRLFLGQLVYMSDILTQKIDFLRDTVDRRTIEKFLEAEVRRLRI